MSDNVYIRSVSVRFWISWDMSPHNLYGYISYSWWGRTGYASSNSFSQSSVTRKLKSGFEVINFQAREKKIYSRLYLPIMTCSEDPIFSESFLLWQVRFSLYKLNFWETTKCLMMAQCHLSSVRQANQPLRVHKVLPFYWL